MPFIINSFLFLLFLKYYIFNVPPFLVVVVVGEGGGEKI